MASGVADGWEVVEPLGEEPEVAVWRGVALDPPQEAIKKAKASGSRAVTGLWFRIRGLCRFRAIAVAGAVGRTYCPVPNCRSPASPKPGMI